MPARGARTTDVAFQTAPILRTSNAMPRLTAWQHIAHLIHSPGQPTARPPAVGTHPLPRSAISAPISESPHVERYWLGACARFALRADPAWDAIEPVAKRAQNIRWDVVTILEC